jgi:hypothetical protein
MHAARSVRWAGIALLLAVALVLTACGPELGPVSRVTSIGAPRLPETSDPSIIREGRTYHVYGSDSHVRAPVMTTTDVAKTYTLTEKNLLVGNAMPNKAPWAVRPMQHWAPTVAKFNSTYVMFFSADRASGYVGRNAQCIGRATSSSPRGPFVAGARPVHCGIDWTGGALDAQIFRDPVTGRWYLLAAFGNTQENLKIMPLDGNGNISGSPTTILARQHPWECGLDRANCFIENPAMVYDPVRRNYLLAYSAGQWSTGGYVTGLARCSRPAGPCTSNPAGPWISSSNGRSGPGGLSWFTNTAGSTYAIFSTHQAGRESSAGGRSASIMQLVLGPSVGLR